MYYRRWYSNSPARILDPKTNSIFPFYSYYMLSLVKEETKMAFGNDGGAGCGCDQGRGFGSGIAAIVVIILLLIALGIVF